MPRVPTQSSAPQRGTPTTKSTQMTSRHTQSLYRHQGCLLAHQGPQNLLIDFLV